MQGLSHYMGISLVIIVLGVMVSAVAFALHSIEAESIGRCVASIGLAFVALVIAICVTGYLGSCSIEWQQARSNAKGKRGGGSS